MRPLAQGDTLPAGRRFVGLDASSLQAPGATGTDHRLHSAMDLLSRQCLEGLVSDVHTGATRKHFTLEPGDVAVADRGALFWKEDAWAACLKVLAERPRRRKLQQLPPAAIDVLYHYDTSKQEGVPIAA